MVANLQLGRQTRGGARRARGGFTLLEMMLVVVIMGLLATVAVVALGGQTQLARKKLTITRMKSVQSAITSYFSQTGNYPATLDDLVKMTPQLLDKLPKDYWNNELYYQYPGTSTDQVNQPFDLLSFGPDHKQSTQDDLDVWKLDENS